jgi:hypothetical protein
MIEDTVSLPGCDSNIVGRLEIGALELTDLTLLSAAAIEQGGVIFRAGRARSNGCGLGKGRQSSLQPPKANARQDHAALLG